MRKPECINSDYPREGSGARRLGGDPPPDQKWILHNLSHVYCDDYSTPCQGPLRTGDYGGNQRYTERMGCKFKCPGSKHTCVDYLHSGNFLCCLSSFLTYVVKNTDYPFQNNSAEDSRATLCRRNGTLSFGTVTLALQGPTPPRVPSDRVGAHTCVLTWLLPPQRKKGHVTYRHLLPSHVDPHYLARESATFLTLKRIG